MAKENRLLSDLWLMSPATFRRLGKIEQAKAAVQEAEVREEGNPGVCVQVSTVDHLAQSMPSTDDSLRPQLLTFLDPKRNRF
jgi:hypothetical protein